MGELVSTTAVQGCLSIGCNIEVIPLPKEAKMLPPKDGTDGIYLTRSQARALKARHKAAAEEGRHEEGHSNSSRSRGSNQDLSVIDDDKASLDKSGFLRSRSLAKGVEGDDLSLGSNQDLSVISSSASVDSSGFAQPLTRFYLLDIKVVGMRNAAGIGTAQPSIKVECGSWKSSKKV